MIPILPSNWSPYELNDIHHSSHTVRVSTQLLIELSDVMRHPRTTGTLRAVKMSPGER